VPDLPAQATRPLKQQLHELLDESETRFGALFTSAMSLLIGGFIAIVITDPKAVPGGSVALWYPLAILWILLDAPAALRWWTLAPRRTERPTAVAVAMCQPIWPLGLRPIAALWWTAHFLFGISAIFVEEYAIRGEGDQPPERVIFLFLSWAYCVVANGYLVLAVGALTRSEATLRSIWARRWAVDVALILTSLISFFLMRPTR
jgi:hypothetical protein